MPTFVFPKKRSRGYMRRGILTFEKDLDEIDTYTIDISNLLNSGETISSISTSVNGVTLNSSALATGIGGSNTAATLTVTGNNGYIEVTFVTSSSRELIRQVQFLASPMAKTSNDYGNVL